MAWISINWRLFTACLALLRRNRRLLVFPLLSLTALATQLAMFLGGAVVVAGIVSDWNAYALLDGLFSQTDGWWTVLLALVPVYVVLNFSTLFLNAAMVACVLTGLEGGRPSIRGGLRAAWASARRIFVWSLITGLVGSLIEWAFSQLPWVGARVAALIGGLAWSMATFFVVPMLVFERGPVLWSIRRSAELMRRTWGRQLSLDLGLHGLFLGVALGAGLAIALLVGVGVHLLPRELGVAAMLAGLAAFVLAMAAIGMVSTCLRTLFTTVLYGYATTGMLPEEIAPELLPPRAEAR